VTNTDDRPDLSSEGAPDIDKTVNVKQKLISGHETQMGLYITSFIMTGSGIQKLIGVDSWIYRQHGDSISLL
jgi:hypothetical protein